LHRFEAFLHNKRIPFVRFGDDLIVLAQQEAGAHHALKWADKQLKKWAGRSGVPALPWLKTDKLAASQTASKQSAKVWQRVWKRRASWVR